MYKRASYFLLVRKRYGGEDEYIFLALNKLDSFIYSLIHFVRSIIHTKYECLYSCKYIIGIKYELQNIFKFSLISLYI